MALLKKEDAVFAHENGKLVAVEIPLTGKGIPGGTTVKVLPLLPDELQEALGKFGESSENSEDSKEKEEKFEENEKYIKKIICNKYVEPSFSMEDVDFMKGTFQQAITYALFEASGIPRSLIEVDVVEKGDSEEPKKE